MRSSTLFHVSLHISHRVIISSHIYVGFSTHFIPPMKMVLIFFILAFKKRFFRLWCRHFVSHFFHLIFEVGRRFFIIFIYASVYFSLSFNSTNSIITTITTINTLFCYFLFFQFIIIFWIIITINRNYSLSITW